MRPDLEWPLRNEFALFPPPPDDVVRVAVRSGPFPPALVLLARSLKVYYDGFSAGATICPRLGAILIS